jgi:hypothetical protein
MANEERRAAAFAQAAFERAGGAREIGPEDLTIWGGQLAEADLARFLDVWQPAVDWGRLVWLMVEEVSRFYVQRAAGAGWPDVEQVERLRLFGEGGDLDVRRDEAVFHWRFVGETAGALPTMDRQHFPFQSFWDLNPDNHFYEVEECYYQWRLQDDRVTNHWSRGTDLAAEGVLLRQKHYLDNGRVAFVRYVDFEEKEHG